jgi:hypothetical protein
VLLISNLGGIIFHTFYTSAQIYVPKGFTYWLVLVYQSTSGSTFARPIIIAVVCCGILDTQVRRSQLSVALQRCHWWQFSDASSYLGCDLDALYMCVVYTLGMALVTCVYCVRNIVLLLCAYFALKLERWTRIRYRSGKSAQRSDLWASSRYCIPEIVSADAWIKWWLWGFIELVRWSGCLLFRQLELITFLPVNFRIIVFRRLGSRATILFKACVLRNRLSSNPWENWVAALVAWLVHWINSAYYLQHSSLVNNY